MEKHPVLRQTASGWFIAMRPLNGLVWKKHAAGSENLHPWAMAGVPIIWQIIMRLVGGLSITRKRPLSTTLWPMNRRMRHQGKQPTGWGCCMKMASRGYLLISVKPLHGTGNPLIWGALPGCMIWPVCMIRARAVPWTRKKHFSSMNGPTI